MTAEIHGTTAPGFAGVRDAFAAALDGSDTGAALAIRHHGAPVADLWGGVADASAGTPWQESTISVVFSCTKGVVSVLAARLMQEGILDYQAPVARYWPEFAVAGKERTTVAQLLAHRAGLSAPRSPVDHRTLLDWDAMTALLAGQAPLWDPGAAYAYHAITHGWLAGELIRRITGRRVGEYLHDVVAAPLGAELWIGLPPEEAPRLAAMEVGATLAELTRMQEEDAPPGRPDWNGLAMTLGGALPRELVGAGIGFNAPDVVAAEVPGAGGVASARALAAMWSATFVETDGVRLLDAATVEAATVPQSEGPPFFEVPGPWPRWGMGLQLDSEARRYVTPGGYGHDGAGGQVAFADPASGIAFAFLTNRMEAIDDVRATRIVDAVRRIVG